MDIDSIKWNFFEDWQKSTAGSLYAFGIQGMITLPCLFTKGLEITNSRKTKTQKQEKNDNEEN